VSAELVISYINSYILPVLSKNKQSCPFETVERSTLLRILHIPCVNAVLCVSLTAALCLY